MRGRAFRLVPWVVRAVIPPGLPGSYILSDGQSPIYAGRSDTDVRARLLVHARERNGLYFAYDVHPGSWQAFLAESAAFHLLDGTSSNEIHPARPFGEELDCPFCPTSIRRALNRADVPVNDNNTTRAETMTGTVGD